MKTFFYSILISLSVACNMETSSGLLDNGSMRVKGDAFEKIKSACGQLSKSNQLEGYKLKECYLLMAGVTNRESSWEVDKECEDHGQPDNPCCGLTQSRQTDAEAAGLTCNVKDDPICNVKTGWLNIVKNGDTISAGIDKHLGGNTAAKPSYGPTMKKVYDRDDVRKWFKVSDSNVRGFDELF